MLAELKQCFLEAYDDNRDGKIDIREVWKRQNAIFCVCVGIHLHLLQKKLYRLLDTAAITFIHQRRQRGQKKVQLLSYFYYCKVGGNPKAWDIAKKKFSMHFLLFSPCFYFSFLEILLVNVFHLLVEWFEIQKIDLSDLPQSYLYKFGLGMGSLCLNIIANACKVNRQTTLSNSVDMQFIIRLKAAQRQL